MIQGDVGGPVVVISSAVNVTPVTWTQVAINSFTKGKCLNKKFLVKTK
jgi:hypothetical protein